MASLPSPVAPRKHHVPVLPGALPVIGHLHQYVRDPLQFLTNAAASGPVVRMRLGPLEAILLRDPADIEKVVIGAHKRLLRDVTTRQLRRVLGDGLLTSEGDTWLRHRRLLSPVFQPASVALLADVMVQVTQRFIERMQAQTQRDLHVDMSQLTLEIVTKTLFDSELGTDVDRVGPAMQSLMEFYGTGLYSVFPWIEKLPLPSVRMAEIAMTELDDVLLGIVRRARGRKGEGKDLLTMLLAARDDAGTGLGDRDVRDHLMTFFLAGHETTALALMFAFYSLSRHPESYEKLRAEIEGVLGDKAPTAADVSRLPHARAVMLETLRLYPPAWAIGRETMDEMTIAGYSTPKGCQLWMAQWVNHRDARYFPEPDQFRPDRWLDNLEKTLPKFAYYPFGGGPRICIGNHFSLMEAILVLAAITRRFRVRMVDDRKPLELVPGITLRPKHPMKCVYETWHRKNSSNLTTGNT